MRNADHTIVALTTGEARDVSGGGFMPLFPEMLRMPPLPDLLGLFPEPAVSSVEVWAISGAFLSGLDDAIPEAARVRCAYYKIKDEIQMQDRKSMISELTFDETADVAGGSKPIYSIGVPPISRCPRLWQPLVPMPPIIIEPGPMF